MNRLPATIRITIGLTLLSASLLLLLRSLGLGPNEERAVLQGRREFCESLALHASLLLTQDDVATLEKSLGALVHRYPDIVAVELWSDTGSRILRVDGPAAIVDAAQPADDTRIRVPLVAKNDRWGELEVLYRPRTGGGLGSLWTHSSTQIGVLFVCGSAVIFFVYLRHNLRHLDPSRIVPERVRSALDTIPAGLVILDAREQILLANKSFAAAVGRAPAELQGLSLNRLRWHHEDGSRFEGEYPWQKTLRDGASSKGTILVLDNEEHAAVCYAVNCTPITAENGAHRGALVSFENVTELQSKSAELSRALDVLRSSRDEVRRQNDELRRMATRDPLTDCLNRRSFYEAFDTLWKSSQRYGHALSCVMVDIDHFKSINDKHGHSAGDVVLQKVAHTLQATVRSTDLVCRYGGEEFCILLPHVDLNAATCAGERFREAILKLNIPGIPVTASLGVSSVELGPVDAQALVDQADKSLYVAKRTGRDQVVRWDRVSESAGQHAEPASGDRAETIAEPSPEIPYHAVSALISALAYRDPKTAEHSRRVADMCVMTASGLMSVRDCYVLEIAGLLHDIGKIGVPDSILLKPGPLTKEEWEIMGVHDRVGVEIIDSAFRCPGLTAIIENHHAWYGGNPREPSLPTGEQIPLGARILALADAYDAITSDRVYRKGRSQAEAFAELRRCAPVQFDAALVERFIQAIQARQGPRAADQGVSPQAALALGQHIERLAELLDKQDFNGLAALAGRMQHTARQYQASELASAAERLQQTIAGEGDLQPIVELVSEVMDLCRTTQAGLLAEIAARSEYRYRQLAPPV